MSSSARDLTQGSVVKQLVRYALPMVVTSLMQALYSMADLIISGHFIGSAGISAINNSSQVMNISTNIIIGLTTGGSVLIGQYFGSQDAKRRQEATGTLFTLVMGLGIAAMGLLLLLVRPILTALGAPAMAQSCQYLRICALGVPFICGYNALAATLRAIGNSKQPFYCIAASTTLNVLLDLLFVGWLRWGTGGAALATIAAQGVAFLLALSYLARRPAFFSLRLSFLRPHLAQVKGILRLGIPSSIQMIIGSVSWLSVTYLINSYGVLVSAGNGVSIKIKDFCQLFISAMASSASAMIAQNLGAQKYDRARNVLYTTMRFTLGMAAGIILVVQLFAPQLVAIFTSEPGVAQAAIRNLRIEIFSQLFYASFLVYHALAIGAGHALFTTFSSFCNCILVRVILAFTFNHFFGLDGLYLACAIAPSVSVPLGYWYCKSGIWRRSLAAQAGSETRKAAQPAVTSYQNGGR